MGRYISSACRKAGPVQSPSVVASDEQRVGGNRHPSIVLAPGLVDLTNKKLNNFFAAFMSLELMVHCNPDCIYFLGHFGTRYRVRLAYHYYGYALLLLLLHCRLSSLHRPCTLDCVFALLLFRFSWRIICHVAPTQRCTAPRGIEPHISVLRTRPPAYQVTKAVSRSNKDAAIF